MHALLVIIIVNLFVLLLCGLVAISGRLLRQSGEVELIINHQEPRKIACNQTLLAALGEAGVFLPAACGGKGTCGRCELEVLEGGGPVTPMETILLSPEKLRQFARLACQVKIRQKVAAEVAPKLLTARLYRARLQSSREMTEDIKTMVFNILGDDELHFKAGQYVQVCYQLPWEKVLRAYSIASPSSECKSFSLDVQRVQGGLVSNYLHQLSVGAEIEISGPFGDMYLQNKHLDCPIVLVAGGVGLAPLRSILEQLREQSFPGPVWLFHGARSRSNLYGETIFRDLAAKYSNFSYQPALSRPLLEDGWLEHRGMIHERLERQPIEQAELAVAFVCGPSLMMQAVRIVLVAKGFTSDRILTDPFDF